MIEVIRQQMKEYEDAVEEYQRLYLLNQGALEALKRLLETMEGVQETPPSSASPDPESEATSEN